MPSLTLEQLACLLAKTMSRPIDWPPIHCLPWLQSIMLMAPQMKLVPSPKLSALFLGIRTTQRWPCLQFLPFGKQDLIIGHSWLQKHSLEIHWTTGEVKMSWCSAKCCSGCREEIWEECKTSKIEAHRITTCSEGELPDLISNNDNDNDDEGDLEFEVGDHMFAIGLNWPSEEIHTTSTISQQLAKVFKRNSEPAWLGPTSADTRRGVPNHLCKFDSVFSKESFNILPETNPWDHAIELVPNGSNCKVYPLLPSEQKELDAFIQENLESGWIQPSKSPMASPVFFIKKKKGSLWVVQHQ